MNALTQNFSNISDTNNVNFSESSMMVETPVSSVATREIQPPEMYKDYVLTDTLISEQFVVDAKPFIERPFYLMTVDWDTSTARGNLLPCQFSQMPGDVLRSNPSLMSATKIASLYRCDLDLVISVAGTITHSGCVLVGVIPPIYGALDNGSSQIGLINTILSGPHARLFANEATSVVLHVPWFCNTEMATLDIEPKSGSYVPSLDITPINGNYGTLVFLVLNALSPSSGSSTNLKITVEAVFKSLDMRVPTPRYVNWVTQSSFVSSIGTAVADKVAEGAKKISGDFIDKARAYLKAKTGLHNPNSSLIAERVITTDRNFLNTVDTQTYYETLDSHIGVNRIVDSPIFNTTCDEMMLNHICSKKQYLGTVRVNVGDSTGTLLWSRPISPNQFNFDASTSGNRFTNNIRLMHYLSRAWRGDIKISIEAVMNNKQQVKLRLLQLYNPSVDVLTSFPDYRSILNAPSHLMEFCAGGQVHEVVLPYLCRNEMTPCALDQATESLFHGMYYIYVAQPLANSGDSPSDIHFNIYITGTPSLQFFGYSTRALNTSFPGEVLPPQRLEAHSMKVMNQPQKQNDKMDEEGEENYVNRLQKIDSVRDFIRRVYNVHKFSRELQPGYNYIVFDLDPLMNESPNYLTSLWDSPLRAISSMYYGKFPSFKFQLRTVSFKNQDNVDANSLVTSVFYFPQDQYSYALQGLMYGSVMNETVASIVLSDQNIDYPVPYQSLPIFWNSLIHSHEFAVPNTSLFKFVGGPKKNTNNYVEPTYKFATQDCGSLVVVLFNPYDTPFPIEMMLNVGAGDECRLGFHSVAPLVEIPVAGSEFINTGYGSWLNRDSYPAITPPSFINFTRV